MPVTNAVLECVLPYFAAFCTNLDLAVPLSASPSDYQRIVAGTPADPCGLYVVTKDGYELQFERGCVRRFSSPLSYFYLQDPRELPRFYAKSQMSDAEALRFAQRVAEKLGLGACPHKEPRPQVQKGPVIGTNTVPYYRFTWRERGRRPNPLDMLRIEVDAGRKKVQAVHIADPCARKTNVQQRVAAQLGIKLPPPPRRTEPAPLEVAPHLRPSPEVLQFVLPYVNDFAQKLRLPLNYPITADQVNLKRSILTRYEGKRGVLLTLTDSHQFSFDKGSVTGFHAPDCRHLEGPGEPLTNPPEHFTGTIKYSVGELAKRVEEAVVKKLGYPRDYLFKGRKPVVEDGPPPRTRHGLTRYLIAWAPKSDDLDYSVLAEVDAMTGDIKSLYLRGLPARALEGGPPGF